MVHVAAGMSRLALGTRGLKVQLHGPTLSAFWRYFRSYNFAVLLKQCPEWPQC
jgi:hypothetical protein